MLIFSFSVSIASCDATKHRHFHNVLLGMQADIAEDDYVLVCIPTTATLPAEKSIQQTKQHFKMTYYQSRIG